MQDGISQTDLAESFGVDRRTVATWDREGLAGAARIGDKPVRYDEAKAWRWRYDNKPPDTAPSDKKNLDLREKAARVRIAELELAAVEGRLVPVEMVDETFADVFGRLRSKIIAYKGGLAPRLVGHDSPREVKAVLDVAFDELIEELQVVTDSHGAAE